MNEEAQGSNQPTNQPHASVGGAGGGVVGVTFLLGVSSGNLKQSTPAYWSHNHMSNYQTPFHHQHTDVCRFTPKKIDLSGKKTPKPEECLRKGNRRHVFQPLADKSGTKIINLTCRKHIAPHQGLKTNESVFRNVPPDGAIRLHRHDTFKYK